MNNWFTRHVVRLYISKELPGWGRVYQTFVGSYDKNPIWKDAAPHVIRDKLCGYYRVVDLREWADRSLFFLKRWYDLEAALVVKDFVGPGDHVVDVGANYGHFTMAAAAAVGPQGRVTSFEPNPGSFARLQTHIGLNRLSHVRPFQMGLSDAEGTLTLSVPRINSGEASFGPSDYDDIYQVSCRVGTLDDVIAGKAVDFIKIDVEGFECNVIKGARETISNSRPLVLTEVVDRHLERANSSRTDLLTLMKSLDYTPVSITLLRRGMRQEIRLTAMNDAAFSSHRSGQDVLWVPGGQDGLDRALARKHGWD